LTPILQCDEEASIETSFSKLHEVDHVFFAMLDGLCGEALQLGNVERPSSLCVAKGVIVPVVSSQ
jgi:hypothetical protein